MNDEEGGWRGPRERYGRGFVPGGRADADSVIKEDRVTMLDSMLDEVVSLRVFGRVPVASRGGLAVRGNLLDDERPNHENPNPYLLSYPRPCVAIRTVFAFAPACLGAQKVAPIMYDLVSSVALPNGDGEDLEEATVRKSMSS